jgi:hypothetical protein
LEEACVKHKAIIVLAGALVLTAGTLALAGDSSTEVTEVNEERVVPEIKAYRINPHAPVIDGNLDDAVWKSSKVDLITHFTQTDPDEGANPTESTMVAVVYDEKAVYVAFWCYDSEPDKIDRQLVRRDRWSASDMASVRIDPYHDHKTGAMFTVSAAGTQRDFRIFNDGHTDGAWDAVWSSAVQKQPWGWSAEMEIPYHCLRFQEMPEQTWGIDFMRIVNRKNEVTKWAYVPSAEAGFVSKFGHLTGMKDIQPARHLEVLPYTVSSVETEPTSLGNENGRSLSGNTGVDIKYGLSSNLTLDMTINPDFGQVELDRPVLNLSSYETFLSERRPFFVEGSDLWQSNYRMFYSRRIGRAPGWIDDDDLLYYTDRPTATTILSAAKISGQLAGGTSIAFLGAVTQEETAKYVGLDSVYNIVEDAEGNVITADSAMSNREGIVEPRGGYSVLRVKQDIFGRSSVGGMLTIATQDQRHPALAGAVDWRLFTNNGMFYCNGQAVFSRNDPDDVGLALDVTFGKDAGEHVRGNVGLTIKQPEFDINRLGMTNVEGVKHVYSWWQYRTKDDWWIIRNSWNNINYYYSQNWDGAEVNNGANWNSHVEFTNNWSLGGGVSVQGEKYSDRETRGNGLWEWPVVPTWSWWTSLNTDERRMISFNLNPGGGADRGGSWWANYIGVEFRPNSSMEFSTGVNYTRSRGAIRWVDNFTAADAAGLESDTSVFADLDRETISINASASMMVHRNLSIQLSGRGLISGLDYNNYRPYLGGKAYGPNYTAGALEDNLGSTSYDYNWGSLNSTLLVRWEYRPGSTIYMVWTRSKSDFDDSVNDLDISRDFSKFFSQGSTNVFMVKASYWLNM